MERLLRVRPLDSPEAILVASAMDLGSIVHESLDEFHRARPDIAPEQQWSAADHEQLRSIARQVAARYTARGLTGHPLLWERALLRVLAQLDQLLDDDDWVRGETGRRQVRSELPFGMQGEPPVELALPSGAVVRLRGSADRVDMADDTITVVDYKTGSARSFEDLSEENPTANGTKLQLPVYAKAARAALGRPTTPVTAEYWFVGENKRISVPLTDQVEEAFMRTVDVIVSGIGQGLFPHRPPREDGFVYIACRYCDPDGLGAAEHRQRWARKRNDSRLADFLAVVEPEENA